MECVECESAEVVETAVVPVAGVSRVIIPENSSCPPYRCCVQKNWRILRVRQMPCNGSTWWHECWMSPMGGMRPGGKVRSPLLVLTLTANESVNLMVEPSRFLSQYPTYALQLQQATFHTQLHQCRRDLHSTVTKKHRPQFIWTTRLVG